MAPPAMKPVPVVIRNVPWPLHGGGLRPTLCTEDGAPIAGQSSVEITDNLVTVKFVVDDENVRFT